MHVSSFILISFTHHAAWFLLTPFPLLTESSHYSRCSHLCLSNFLFYRDFPSSPSLCRLLGEKLDHFIEQLTVKIHPLQDIQQEQDAIKRGAMQTESAEREQLCLDLGGQLGYGMKGLHQQGIEHRDIWVSL